MGNWITVEFKGGKIITTSGEELVHNVRRPLGVGSVTLWKDSGTYPRDPVVIKYSKRGRHVYSVRLDEEGYYRFGATRGYKVPTALAEETDAIRRVLRRCQVPIKTLRRVGAGDVLCVQTQWRHPNCTDRTASVFLATDGKKQTLVTKEFGPCPWAKHSSYEEEVREASFAIRYSGNSVTEVCVWPHCDAGALGDALAALVFGPGADRDFPDALSDAAVAAEWIRRKMEIRADSLWGDRLWVNSQEYSVRYAEYGRDKTKVMETLVRAHGAGLLDPYLGDIQKELVAARFNIDNAVSYVASRYDLVAMERGGQNWLKIRRKGTEEELHGFGYFNHETEPDIAVLKEAHPILWQQLWSMATESVKLVGFHQPCLEQEGVIVDLDLRMKDNPLGVALHGSMQCLTHPPVHSWSDYGPQRPLVDGDNCRIDGGRILFPVKPGEMKHFLLHGRGMGREGSVWGVSVRRDADGSVVFEPHDNKRRYRVDGDEVVALAVTVE